MEPSTYCDLLMFTDLREESSDSDSDVEFDEEEAIKYYFNRGFEYQEIILFLAKNHNYSISYSTLLRKLKQYGLSRRTLNRQNQVGDVRKRIEETVSSPGSAGGYRSVWHTLELEGLRVPRIIVQHLLREIDPEGVSARKAHRLKRRVYSNPGPNYAWHLDGYDKLKPWGFPMHGCIDGFSRRILWLKVARSNNLPEIPGQFYVETVAELGGVPVELVTDLGTENGLVASMQCYLRENNDAHRYVSSPRNQRIEGWWCFFCKNRTSWWRSFFQDLETQETVDTTSQIHKECLWYCFSCVLQKECDHVKEHWNTHRIRKSRHDTVHGRPDSLFFLPEYHGGATDLLFEVPVIEINEVTQQCIRETENNVYEEYFEYVRASLGVSKPTTWQSALELFQKLIFIAQNGYTG